MTKEQLMQRLRGERVDGYPAEITMQFAADEITQLRGNLSLAEEGLAAAMQEIERQKAEITRLQNHLISVKQARLDWAMVCECQCAACETFSNVIRLIGRGAVEPCEQLSASEAASFGKTLARSPRRIESAAPQLRAEPREQRSREDEAFRLLNAATYYVPKDRELTADIVAWLNGSPPKHATDKGPPSVCAYIGAPQGEPEPCTLPAGHSKPHKHAEKSEVASSATTIPCIYRQGCRKFPACVVEGRCCGHDDAIPMTR